MYQGPALNQKIKYRREKKKKLEKSEEKESEIRAEDSQAQDILFVKIILEQDYDLFGMLQKLGPLILGIPWRCWRNFLQKSDTWEMVHTCIFFQNGAMELKITACVTYQLRNENCISY